MELGGQVDGESYGVICGSDATYLGVNGGGGSR